MFRIIFLLERSGMWLVQKKQWDGKWVSVFSSIDQHEAEQWLDTWKKEKDDEQRN